MRGRSEVRVLRRPGAVVPQHQQATGDDRSLSCILSCIKKKTKKIMYLINKKMGDMFIRILRGTLRALPTL